MLSVEQISSRLDDCFRLLTTENRTAIPRHRTLRATIDWSHELLSEGERVLFRRLSVFAGGGTLEAAERVCVGEGVEKYDILDLLSRLVDKSLMLVTERDGEVRYRLLEIVRRYAKEKLEYSGEETWTRNRHASFFLELAEEAEPALFGAEQGTWLERLETEYDNLRVALEWLREEGEAEQGLRLGSSLWRFWWLQSHFTEGRSQLAALLETPPGARTAARAKALHVLGSLTSRHAEYADAAGKFAEARRYQEEALSIYRELGDKRGIANTLGELGRATAAAAQDYRVMWEQARPLFEESLKLERELDDKHGLAMAHLYLGIVHHFGGDPATARHHFEECLNLSRDLGDELYAAGIAPWFLARVALDEGDPDAARTLLKEILETLPLARYRWFSPRVLEGFAQLAATQNRPTRALKLAGAAAALRDNIGASEVSPFRAYIERRLEPAWQVLGGEAGEVAWVEGQRMTLEQAIAYALEEPLMRQEEENSRPSFARVRSGGTVPRPEETQLESLTGRETEVLRLLAGGKTNKEIAQELALSVSTVQRHVANIYAKIGAHNRAEATVYACRHDIDKARLSERSPSQ